MKTSFVYASQIDFGFIPTSGGMRLITGLGSMGCVISDLVGNRI